MKSLFSVMTAGINSKHPYPLKVSQKEGIKQYVFLSIKSFALFSIADQEYTIDRPMGIIIEPNTSYEYFNPNGSYIDDYFRFEGPALIFQQYNYPLNTFIEIQEAASLNNLFQEFIWDYNYGDPLIKDITLDHYVNLLIHKLFSNYDPQGNKQNYTPYNKRLREYRIKMLADPQNCHPVEFIAKKLQISTTYVQHLYKTLFGISYQKDLITIRIDHAKYYISNTDQSIETIAELCGYSSEVHFYRQFKQLTGHTPSEFRSLPSV